MVVKYKIHELAKDLDLKSNAVIDLLKKIDETPKKSQTSLTSDELDFVFDQMTKEYGVESFDAYFAAKKPEEKLCCNVVLNAPEIAEMIYELTGELNYAAVYNHTNAFEKGAPVQKDPQGDKLNVTLR